MKIIDKVKAIVNNEYPLVTNLSNVSSVLKEMKDINWCGFYLVDKNCNLYLGPFQGDVACAYIKYGKGVCGTCLEKKESIIVPDVSKFVGHIACSSLSKSEIVVPIIKNGIVMALIDIDSPLINRFNEEDRKMLELVADVLKELDY